MNNKGALDSRITAAKSNDGDVFGMIIKLLDAQAQPLTLVSLALRAISVQEEPASISGILQSVSCPGFCVPGIRIDRLFLVY
ncbi:MAG: hypothetical protein ACMG6H_16290 [Acidobacteriota bacterium]